jgi:serine/threonine protein kinase
MEIDPDEIIIDQPIGAGAYGTVFSGNFRGLNVAIKKFHVLSSPPSGGNSSVGGHLLESNSRATRRRERFVQEALFLSSLRHPRIVRMLGYTYFPNNRTFALIMEYVSRGSLFDLLHRSPNLTLLVSQALWFARDIAEGMSFLHRSGVLHRDLKSANVLVDESSRPKICDFGLSKEENSESFAVSAPSVHGTIAWSPPETLRGLSCTAASDVYSFGIIMCVFYVYSVYFCFHSYSFSFEVFFSLVGMSY